MLHSFPAAEVGQLEMYSHFAEFADLSQSCLSSELVAAYFVGSDVAFGFDLEKDSWESLNLLHSVHFDIETFASDDLGEFGFAGLSDFFLLAFVDFALAVAESLEKQMGSGLMLTD